MGDPNSIPIQIVGLIRGYAPPSNNLRPAIAMLRLFSPWIYLPTRV